MTTDSNNCEQDWSEYELNKESAVRCWSQYIAPLPGGKLLLPYVLWRNGTS